MIDRPAPGGGPEDRAAAESGGVPPGAGLCARCLHARLVVSGRGSAFVLCERSRGDGRFPRYPPLPVRSCAGFEARSAP